MAEETFLSLGELKAIFPRLKKDEDSLTLSERQVLTRIERTLYDHLSIQEIESTLQEVGGIS
jgi:hypothetical protein